LGKFAHYDETYGSLGAAIGLMIWMWLSITVILVGAELNSEIEHQTARDSTVGSGEKPLGARGAAMADTVGAAAGGAILLQQARQPHGDDGRRAGADAFEAAAQRRSDLGRVGDVLAIGAGRFRLLGEVDRRIEVAAVEAALPGVAVRIGLDDA